MRGNRGSYVHKAMNHPQTKNISALGYAYVGTYYMHERSKLMHTHPRMSSGTRMLYCIEDDSYIFERNDKLVGYEVKGLTDFRTAHQQALEDYR